MSEDLEQLEQLAGVLWDLAGEVTALGMALQQAAAVPLVGWFATREEGDPIPAAEDVARALAAIAELRSSVNRAGLPALRVAIDQLGELVALLDRDN